MARRKQQSNHSIHILQLHEAFAAPGTASSEQAQVSHVVVHHLVLLFSQCKLMIT